MANFSRSKVRLDMLYFCLIGSSLKYTELFPVIRSVLILSHRIVAVESGFSINKDFIVENLQEDSLVVQRTIYDAVKACGGMAAVDITKAMLQYVCRYNARYKDHLNIRERRLQRKQKELHRRNEQRKTLIMLKPKKSNLRRRLL